MASVRKRKGSKYWYACINLPNGDRRHFSTKQEDKSEALAIATNTESAFKNHSTHADLMSRLAHIAETFAPESSVAPGPWLRQWAESRKSEVSPKTAASYRSNLKAIADSLEERGIKSFSEITPVVLQQIRADHAKNITSGTLNLRLDIIRVALNAAVEHGLIAKNPALSVKKLKVAKGSRRREFRPEELKTLINHLSGEWKVLTLLGIYTGQRLNDLAELRRRNVNLSDNSVHFRTSKTGELVSLPMAKSLADAVAELPLPDDPESFLLPEIASLKAGTRSNRFMGILKECGIVTDSADKPEVGRSFSPISFHSLRHTTTTLLKSAGVSDAIARAIVGHSSKAVSEQYTHLDPETLRVALNKMPSL